MPELDPAMAAILELIRAQDLPPFEDYAMAGRTYRYFHGEPTYAFGDGRSFTTFRYSDLRIAQDAGV